MSRIFTLEIDATKLSKRDVARTLRRYASRVEADDSAVEIGIQYLDGFDLNTRSLAGYFNEPRLIKVKP